MWCVGVWSGHTSQGWGGSSGGTSITHSLQTQAEEQRHEHGWSQISILSLLAPDHHGSWVSSRAVMQPLKTLPLPLLASQFLPSDK